MYATIVDDAVEGPLFAELATRLGGRPDLSAYHEHSHWYALDDAPRILPELIIRSVAALLPTREGVVGVEWWIQNVDPSRGMIWHFDHDREVLARDGSFVHPLWASIFYFDDGDGPTVIVDQTLEELRARPRQPPPAGFICEPRSNRFAAFAGNLRHGVAAAPQGQRPRRVTMPLNWWSTKPLEPSCRATPYAEPPFVALVPGGELSAVAPRTPAARTPSARTPGWLDAAELAALTSTSPPAWRAATPSRI